ncbi:MAG: oligopeptide transporter, OPT family [Deltaproteobacteria bacterium]|nr:oligopeptide transporter, OPT family [Deltaproteobacteria bacterium]
MNKEFTIRAILIGVPIAVVMTAANVYLGLYAGMTVAASIPAAVVAMGIFRGIMGQKSPHETNIIQTMASAGESIAGGVIFTIPALVLVGVWQDFQFWPTYIITATGGLLGVVFMIPLRKALIVEDKDLVYPEGVACAAIIEAGQQEGDLSGMKTIGLGLLVGGVFKVLSSGIKVIVGSVEKAFMLGKSVLFLGADVAPALVGVGYIINLHIASLVFIGGVIGWFIGIPLLGTPEQYADLTGLDLAWTLWSKEVRYVGVGAMIIGGIWSIVSVRKGIMSGLSEIKTAYKTDTSQVAHTDKNMNAWAMLILFCIAFVGVFGIYYFLLGALGITLLSTLLMIVLAFFLVAVASYIVGLVGTSNAPVSGMTISALLVTSGLFLALGMHGDSAIIATLGVAAVVCCAISTAGDCSQDLKTGHMLKTSPGSQQWAQVIGVVVPTLVIPPVLALLHHAYGIGDGLKAPQATLFASIVDAFFGDGSIPINMVVYGAVMGIVMILVDELYLKAKGGFRLYLMPTAIGIYLPITLAVPIFTGGLIRYLVEKRRTSAIEESKDKGVLLGSGFIAGEAIMGVLIAILVFKKIDISVDWFGPELIHVLSIAAFLFISGYLYKVAKRS